METYEKMLYLLAHICLMKCEQGRDYIILFKKPQGMVTHSLEQQIYENHTARILEHFRPEDSLGRKLLNGYLATLSDDTKEKVMNDEGVAVVEEDGEVNIASLFQAGDEDPLAAFLLKSKLLEERTQEYDSQSHNNDWGHPSDESNDFDSEYSDFWAFSSDLGEVDELNDIEPNYKHSNIANRRKTRVISELGDTLSSSDDGTMLKHSREYVSDRRHSNPVRLREDKPSRVHENLGRPKNGRKHLNLVSYAQDDWDEELRDTGYPSMVQREVTSERSAKLATSPVKHHRKRQSVPKNHHNSRESTTALNDQITQSTEYQELDRSLNDRSDSRENIKGGMPYSPFDNILGTLVDISPTHFNNISNGSRMDTKNAIDATKEQKESQSLTQNDIKPEHLGLSGLKYKNGISEWKTTDWGNNEVNPDDSDSDASAASVTRPKARDLIQKFVKRSNKSHGKIKRRRHKNHISNQSIIGSSRDIHQHTHHSGDFDRYILERSEILRGIQERIAKIRGKSRTRFLKSEIAGQKDVTDSDTHTHTEFQDRYGSMGPAIPHLTEYYEEKPVVYQDEANDSGIYPDSILIENFNTNFGGGHIPAYPSPSKEKSGCEHPYPGLPKIRKISSYIPNARLLSKISRKLSLTDNERSRGLNVARKLSSTSKSASSHTKTGIESREKTQHSHRTTNHNSANDYHKDNDVPEKDLWVGLNSKNNERFSKIPNYDIANASNGGLQVENIIDQGSVQERMPKTLINADVSATNDRSPEIPSLPNLNTFESIDDSVLKMVDQGLEPVTLPDQNASKTKYNKTPYMVGYSNSELGTTDDRNKTLELQSRYDLNVQTSSYNQHSGLIEDSPQITDIPGPKLMAESIDSEQADQYHDNTVDETRDSSKTFGADEIIDALLEISENPKLSTPNTRNTITNPRSRAIFTSGRPKSDESKSLGSFNESKVNEPNCSEPGKSVLNTYNNIDNTPQNTESTGNQEDVLNKIHRSDPKQISRSNKQTILEQFIMSEINNIIHRSRKRTLGVKRCQTGKRRHSTPRGSKESDMTGRSGTLELLYRTSSPSATEDSLRTELVQKIATAFAEVALEEYYGVVTEKLQELKQSHFMNQLSSANEDNQGKVPGQEINQNSKSLNLKEDDRYSEELERVSALQFGNSGSVEAVETHDTVENIHNDTKESDMGSPRINDSIHSDLDTKIKKEGVQNAVHVDENTSDSGSGVLTANEFDSVAENVLGSNSQLTRESVDLASYLFGSSTGCHCNDSLQSDMNSRLQQGVANDFTEQNHDASRIVSSAVIQAKEQTLTDQSQLHAIKSLNTTRPLRLNTKDPSAIEEQEMLDFQTNRIIEKVMTGPIDSTRSAAENRANYIRGLVPGAFPAAIHVSIGTSIAEDKNDLQDSEGVRHKILEEDKTNIVKTRLDSRESKPQVFEDIHRARGFQQAQNAKTLSQSFGNKNHERFTGCEVTNTQDTQLNHASIESGGRELEQNLDSRIIENGMYNKIVNREDSRGKELVSADLGAQSDNFNYQRKTTQTKQNLDLSVQSNIPCVELDTVTKTMPTMIDLANKDTAKRTIPLIRVTESHTEDNLMRQTSAKIPSIGGSMEDTQLYPDNFAVKTPLPVDAGLGSVLPEDLNLGSSPGVEIENNSVFFGILEPVELLITQSPSLLEISEFRSRPVPSLNNSTSETHQSLAHYPSGLIGCQTNQPFRGSEYILKDHVNGFSSTENLPVSSKDGAEDSQFEHTEVSLVKNIPKVKDNVIFLENDAVGAESRAFDSPKESIPLRAKNEDSATQENSEKCTKARESLEKRSKDLVSTHSKSKKSKKILKRNRKLGKKHNKRIGRAKKREEAIKSGHFHKDEEFSTDGLSQKRNSNFFGRESDAGSAVTEGNNKKREIMTQKSATWGLSRISHKHIVPQHEYLYPEHPGKGVDIYIIDTGIQINHPEFENRARFGVSFLEGTQDLDDHGHGTHCAGTAAGKTVGIAKEANLIAVKALDAEGRGRFSTVILGIDWVIRDHLAKQEKMEAKFRNAFNVAQNRKFRRRKLRNHFKKTGNAFSKKKDPKRKHTTASSDGNQNSSHEKTTHPTRYDTAHISVDNNSAFTSDMTQNDYISEDQVSSELKEIQEAIVPSYQPSKFIRDLQKYLKTKKSQPRSVVNVSLGGSKSRAINFAIEYGTNLGVHFVVAAGNDHEDACEYSPGSSSKALTVGASTSNDTIAFFSNNGSCVDIYAPGASIYSSWIDGGFKTLNGTSMASPHAAGVVALHLGVQNTEPGITYQKIKNDGVKTLRKQDEMSALNFWPLKMIFGQDKRPLLNIAKLLERLQ